MNQGFKHYDKLAAINLAERNSVSGRGTKSIVVQHFNDAGVADSPASLVTTQPGHSPIVETAINGGYFMATEIDAEVDSKNSSLLQLEQNQQNQQSNQQSRQYANR